MDLRRELVTVESGHVVVAIDDEDVDEVPQLPDEFGAPHHHGAQRGYNIASLPLRVFY